MLLYIHKIEWCEAYHLQSAILMLHDRQAILRDVAPWRTLPIVGLAAFEPQRKWKTVLDFTQQNFLLRWRKLLYFRNVLLLSSRLL